MEPLIQAAIKQARLAYLLAPNSYTNAAFHAAIAVEEAFNRGGAPLRPPVPTPAQRRLRRASPRISRR